VLVCGMSAASRRPGAHRNRRSQIDLRWMLRRLQYVGAGAIMIPNHRHAQQRNATRSADIRAVSAFWARAERYRGEQLEAAKAILETPASIARNGGEASATVVWARMAVRRANEAAQ